MKTNFIPYKLKTSLFLLKDKLDFIEVNEDVFCYKPLLAPAINIYNIKSQSIFLYFFDDILISLFIKLENEYNKWENILNSLEVYFKAKCFTWEVDEGMLHHWTNDEEFIGLLVSKQEQSISILYTLKEYNPFNEDIEL